MIPSRGLPSEQFFISSFMVKPFPLRVQQIDSTRKTSAYRVTIFVHLDDIEVVPYQTTRVVKGS